MKGFPENIDEIEAFYKGELHDDAIEPPVGLWESIAAQLPPAPIPSVPPVSSFMGVAAKTWFVSSVITASLVGLYVSYKTAVLKEAPIVNSQVLEVSQKDSANAFSSMEKPNDLVQPIENKSSEENDYSVTKNKEKEISPSNSVDNQKNSISNESAPVLEELPSSTPSEDPLIEEENATKGNVDLELVAPKINEGSGVKGESKDHHKSFFDKKTAQLKDSARPLFVPKKGK